MDEIKKIWKNDIKNAIIDISKKMVLTKWFYWFYYRCTEAGKALSTEADRALSTEAGSALQYAIRCEAKGAGRI